MRNILLLLVLVVLSFTVKAQVTGMVTVPLPDSNMQSEYSKPVTYNQLPSFPGGLNRFNLYITLRIKYPDNIPKGSFEGQVLVSFIVEKDGSLTDIKVLKGLSSEIDSEVTRALQTSIKWMPGKINNINIRTKCTVPITFALAK